MIEYTIDPIEWYSTRKVNICPKHFVVVPTQVTSESLHWVLDKLSGRFSLLDSSIRLNGFIVNYSSTLIAFENPKEAILYELTWS